MPSARPGRRIRSRLIPSAVAVLIATAATGFGVLRATPSQAQAGAAVSVWETTPDQSQLLAAQAGTSFSPGTSTQSLAITVNPATSYQTMTGFGASFTDSSAWLVYNSPLRSQIMSKLFSPSQGIGLDFLRQPIGASDFSLSTYSYDDMPSGQADPTLAHFSIAHDDAYIIPILQQALALNPAITVMATPWSPPGWMKTSGSMIGGTLQSGDYQYFANYLVKFLQAYQAAGVPVALISPQNEPEYSPSNYPGSTFTSTQEADFIADNLGPAIQSAGLSTKILDYDHNWNDPSFPETVLGDSAAAQYVSGTAWHCYAGDPSAMSTVEAQYPSYGTYQTECSGTQASDPADTFADTLDWEAQNLLIGSVRNYSSSVVTWNMALDPSGGPSMNCTTCTAVVTVDNSAGTATYNAEYYALGQLSKFVLPGAVRIASSTYGSGSIEDVAFRNPSGATALLVLNDNSSAQTFGVNEDGQSFSYTLPAGAVATFTWPAPGATSSISTSAWYEVQNTQSGLCAEAASAGTANGTAVQQDTCTGAASQLWQFQYDGNGYYHVANQNAQGEVWDVTGGQGATSNGTPIQIWSSTGGTNQQWGPVALSDGDYEFAAENSGTECLDVTGESTSPGTTLQQWACSGPDPAQSFALIPVS
jgi:glucosylceramidase